MDENPEFYSDGESGTRAAIARFQNEYLSVKHVLLARLEPLLPGNWVAQAEQDEELYTQLIARLALCGAAVQEELFYIPHCVDPFFCVFIDVNSEAEYVWAGCAHFIRDLPPDMQEFVFGALLSRELTAPVFQEIDSATASEEQTLCEKSPEDNQLQRRITQLQRSGMVNKNLYLTIEAASRVLLADYLKRYAVAKELSNRTQASSHLEALPDEHLQDGIDSLKAAQNEIIRLLNPRKAAEYVPYIASELGKSLYQRLHKATRRRLRDAEYLYHLVNEPRCVFACVIAFAESYLTEVLIRLMWPAVEAMRRTGVDDATADSSQRRMLRQFENRYGPGIGDISNYLRQVKFVHDYVANLGLDADRIADDTAVVAELRNKGAHPVQCDKAVADEMRTLLLNREGLFSHLFLNN